MNPVGWFLGSAVRTALSVITSTVDAGAAEALRLTGSMLNATTSPGLLSSWFSATYWRVAALSALLTVPFLFAAAVHALVRSDLALLARAAFGYLPLAAIGITIAAPLTTLLLSATDEMCSVVAAAAGHADSAALASAASGIVALSAMTDNPMLAFFIGLLALLATIGLWIELLVRAAAVDVIVLMLPLFFAAMVWPARRVWAIRAIETLIALILAKFAIVAVLTLGGAAFGGPSSNLSSTLVGATLIVLAVFSPWALLRVLPLHEVAAAAAGGLSAAPHEALRSFGRPVMDGLRATAGAQEAWGGSAGLGPEDDADQAMERAVGFRVPGLGGGAAHQAGGGTGRAGAPRAFDAETAAGLSAVARPRGTGAGAGGAGAGGAGAGGAGAGGAGVGDGTIVLAQAPDDDRPPINEQFAPGAREVFELGDGPMEWPALREPGSEGGEDGAGPAFSLDRDADAESSRLIDGDAEPSRSTELSRSPELSRSTELDAPGWEPS